MSNVIKESEWEFLLKSLMFNLFLSSLVAVYQFVTSFPVRAYGLSGTENHLAMQVVHVSLIFIIFYGRSNYLINALRVIGLVTLSRAYLIYLGVAFLQKKIWFGLLGLLVIFFLLSAGLQKIDNEMPKTDSIDFLIDRLDFMENSSDQDGRGYLRVIQSPQYFIYGSSEVVRKFDGDPFFGQIHSNFLSLAFCFGIPGIIFSILILWKVFSKVGFILFLAYFLYSLSLYYYLNPIFLIFTAFLFRSYARRPKELSATPKLMFDR